MATITSTDIHQDRAEFDPQETILQIGIGCMMTVGASDIQRHRDALAFKARIHPRRADGKRASAARVMDVLITLGHEDLYRISVSYFDRRTFSTVTHWDCTGVYGDSLSTIFLALDNGEESR